MARNAADRYSATVTPSNASPIVASPSALHPGDETASARFQAISEAYTLRTDEEKRRLYGEAGAEADRQMRLSLIRQAKTKKYMRDDEESYPRFALFLDEAQGGSRALHPGDDRRRL